MGWIDINLFSTYLYVPLSLFFGKYVRLSGVKFTDACAFMTLHKYCKMLTSKRSYGYVVAEKQLRIQAYIRDSTEEKKKPSERRLQVHNNARLDESNSLTTRPHPSKCGPARAHWVCARMRSLLAQLTSAQCDTARLIFHSSHC